jgi:predicted P-loop ATPase
VVDYLGCEDTPLNRAIGRLMLIASVRRARKAGCKFDPICVVEGPEGVNKSTVIRVLASDENFSDQSVLNVSDREAQEQLEGVWLHESADLTGLKKAEVERVKAFASRQRDRARPAYGRVREDRPRRCTQWATTNDVAYLASQPGNRRFWPLPVSSIDVEALRRDRDQLWGEAATLEAKGASIMLDPALWLAAADEQEKRRIRDTWEDVYMIKRETDNCGIWPSAQALHPAARTRTTTRTRVHDPRPVNRHGHAQPTRKAEEAQCMRISLHSMLRVSETPSCRRRDDRSPVSGRGV